MGEVTKRPGKATLEMNFQAIGESWPSHFCYSRYEVFLLAMDPTVPWSANENEWQPLDKQMFRNSCSMLQPWFTSPLFGFTITIKQYQAISTRIRLKTIDRSDACGDLCYCVQHFLRGHRLSELRLLSHGPLSSYYVMNYVKWIEYGK